MGTDHFFLVIPIPILYLFPCAIRFPDPDPIRYPIPIRIGSPIINDREPAHHCIRVTYPSVYIYIPIGLYNYSVGILSYFTNNVFSFQNIQMHKYALRCITYDRENFVNAYIMINYVILILI